MEPWQTKQTSYGPFWAYITIFLVDGSSFEFPHFLVFPGEAEESRYRPEQTVSVPIPNRIDKKILYIPNRTFGTEFELTAPGHRSKHNIAKALTRRGIYCRVSPYTHDVTTFWKIVDDRSIRCNIEEPTCNTLELVSPILQSNGGLEQIEEALKILLEIPVSVNSSTGFHVHIQANDLDLPKLKKICKNFVKYEEAFDYIVPKSRRNNEYIKSNRAAFGSQMNNARRHRMIDRCQTMDDLVELMNPGQDRYYKLNLQPLYRDSPTIEFRQHSGTSNVKKAICWIRLITLFVENSTINKDPNNFKDGAYTPEEKFKKMIEW
eukprot:CAMPEP_0174265216 /NCGR_PEP_ID=MMETSP0439-20130205/25639_1 /TAXON_ID=0 /ORGANISM="Stereomyxa ramosa, Strain Chinc5" /LENGTH=319 /DNA_ID=CAMNT_0015351559 /DNA_START=177 /DNA_END=1133 /DNA_ORIENTATION=+